jgi:Ni,Fe-hydrogenase III component G
MNHPKWISTSLLVFLGFNYPVESVPLQDFPIQSVQVFSNQAEVTRMRSVSLLKGVNRYEIPDLPGSIIDDSVRVAINTSDESNQIKILTIEVESYYDESFKTEEAKEAELLLKKAESKLRELSDEYTTLKEEENTLKNIQVGKIPSDDETTQPRPVIDTKRWVDTLDFIYISLDKNNSKMNLVLDEIDKARQELHLAAFLFNRLKSGKSTHKKAIFLELESNVDSKKTISISYRVPNASWFPAYTAKVKGDGNKAKVQFISYALLNNETGEDWNDVRLSFSAANPQTSAVLPIIKQWKIESRLLVDEEEESPSMEDLPSPAPVAKKESRLRAKYKALKPSLATEPNSQAAQSMDYYSNNKNTITDKRASKISDSAESNIQAFQSNISRRDESIRNKEFDSAIQYSELTIQNIESIDPKYKKYFMEERSNSEKIKRQALEMQENQNLMRNLVSPLLSSRGFNYSYSTQSKETVYSDSAFRKIFLAEKSLDADLFYEGNPLLQKTAFLTGKVSYNEDQPMLAGPVSVFHDRDYVGDSVLGNISKKQKFLLHLGANEDISLERKSDQFREKSGILSTNYLYKNTITILTKNKKNRNVSITLFDRIPFSSDSKIKIGKPRINKEPSKYNSDYGLLEFQLQIPPNAEEKITIEYDLTHSEDVITEYKEMGSPEW